jgi:hypothetical protein
MHLNSLIKPLSGVLLSNYPILSRTAIGASLLTALLRRIWPASSTLISSALSQDRIKVGSVENAGNTCILSVLLQEIAALPELYDACLYSKLQPCPHETPQSLKLRQQLQKHLADCISKLRLNLIVNKKEMQQLSHLLLSLGWLANSTALWRRLLHQWAPSIFSLPLSSPHEAYDTFLSLFAEYPSHKMILMGQNSAFSVRQILKKEQALSGQSKQVFWRIACNPDNKVFFPRQFKHQNYIYQLRLVHVKQMDARHVILYRKEQKRWLCCNDTSIQVADSLPKQGIYALMYSSNKI